MKKKVDINEILNRIESIHHLFHAKDYYTAGYCLGVLKRQVEELWESTLDTEDEDEDGNLTREIVVLRNQVSNLKSEIFTQTQNNILIKETNTKLNETNEILNAEIKFLKRALEINGIPVI
mgnify:CR=1 FL=1